MPTRVGSAPSSAACACAQRRAASAVLDGRGEADAPARADNRRRARAYRRAAEHATRSNRACRDRRRRSRLRGRTAASGAPSRLPARSGARAACPPRRRFRDRGPHRTARGATRDEAGGLFCCLRSSIGRRDRDHLAALLDRGKNELQVGRERVTVDARPASPPRATSCTRFGSGTGRHRERARRSAKRDSDLVATSSCRPCSLSRRAFTRAVCRARSPSERASRHDDIFRRIEPLDTSLEREREARPERGVPAVRVEVPALAAAGRPHRALHLGVDAGDEGVLRLDARLDGREALASSR